MLKISLVYKSLSTEFYNTCPSFILDSVHEPLLTSWALPPPSTTYLPHFLYTSVKWWLRSSLALEPAGLGLKWLLHLQDLWPRVSYLSSLPQFSHLANGDAMSLTSCSIWGNNPLHKTSLTSDSNCKLERFPKHPQFNSLLVRLAELTESSYTHSLS